MGKLTKSARDKAIAKLDKIFKFDPNGTGKFIFDSGPESEWCVEFLPKLYWKILPGPQTAWIGRILTSFFFGWRWTKCIM